MSKSRIPVVQVVTPGELDNDLYKKREKIYNRLMIGFFQKIRHVTIWSFLAGYFFLPWLNWEGRQAILFDLPARQFHILGLTFFPQDFLLLSWLLIISAFSLFLITAVAGRLWCGYTCPQTVWTTLFMLIEYFTEGDRNKRMKLDKQPAGVEKILRKSAKHGLWLFVAFATGFTFVGYFTPIQSLLFDMTGGLLGGWGWFWCLFFTVMTYLNAGWMREQVCIYMCPYARFQSVMFDRDTLIVTYDAARGEPRGSRKKSADHKALGLGDCVNCSLCVQVCPTGIDIRNGLQYECIGCAACIDVCDSVMDQLGYDRGLVRYSTENRIEGKTGRILRGRIIGYVMALLVMSSAFSWVLLTRVPLEFDVLRDRRQLYRETWDGHIENVYTLKIRNKAQQPHRYLISVEGLPDPEIRGSTQVSALPGELVTTALDVRVDRPRLSSDNIDVTITVTSVEDASISRRVDTRFLSPHTP
jgi:cytochrome c oxidase accessory protein FixG